MRNQEYNLAGKTLVVERVKQLKGSKSDYIRQVTKTAQANKKIDEKETQEFYIKALPSTIERDDVRRDSQTIVLQAIVNGYKDPVPNFEINGLPRMCGHHTGDTKATLITTLESYITNQTPYTPNFSGTNNWSRGGALFTVGDTVSVGYFCSDNSYVTAIMTVTTVNTSTITGTVNSIVYTLKGFDDRDTTNTQLYIPYAQAVPLNVVLYNGADQMDSIELSVVNNTRHRRTFGVDSSAKGNTYTEGVTEYNYIEGDSFVQVSVSGDTKTAVIKAYIQDSWIELNNFPTYSRYDEILTDSLPDVFSVYQAENHVVAAGYDWFKQIIAEHISAVYYFVGGAIYGYGQNGYVDMTQPPGQRAQGDAFIIDANGIMEISSGYARNLNVRGILNLYADNGTDAGAEIYHPTLTTVTGSPPDESGGATVSPIVPAEWNSSALYDNANITPNHLYDNVVGAYDVTYPITQLVRLTDPSVVYIPGITGRYVDLTYYPTQADPEYVSLAQNDYSQELKFTRMSTGWGYYYSWDFAVAVNGTVVVPYAVSHQLPLSVTVPAGAVVTVWGGAWGNTYCHLEYEWVAVSFSDIGLTQRGFWIEYDGAWQNLDTAATISNSMYLTNPIQWKDPGHYQIPSAFLQYTGGDVTMTVGTPYRIDSSNLIYNGQSIKGVFLTINQDGSRTLFYTDNNGQNQASITISAGSYWYLSGNISIAETKGGVEMMGQYPKADMVYDIGTPTKRWLTGYISSLPLTSKLSEKKDVVAFEKDALPILNAVDVVRYKLKADPNGTPLIGFIADYTDAEISGQKHDSMMVNNCIGVLIKAIQELSAEINKLKTEIQNLKG